MGGVVVDLVQEVVLMSYAGHRQESGMYYNKNSLYSVRACHCRQG
jgi:hypothetical protein